MKEKAWKDCASSPSKAIFQGFFGSLNVTVWGEDDYLSKSHLHHIGCNHLVSKYGFFVVD